MIIGFASLSVMRYRRGERMLACQFAAMALLLVCAPMGLSKSKAAIFDYVVSFEIDLSHTVTGSIATSCNNCLLDQSNIVSWSFALDGSLGFSSSDGSATIYNRGTSSLKADVDYLDFVPAGVIEFCVNSLSTPCDFPELGLSFIGEGINVIEYLQNNSTPSITSEIAPGYSGQHSALSLLSSFTIACDQSITCAATPFPQFPPSPSAVPEPSTWAMMALGFAGLGFVGLLRRTSRLA